MIFMDGEQEVQNGIGSDSKMIRRTFYIDPLNREMRQISPAVRLFSPIGCGLLLFCVIRQIRNYFSDLYFLLHRP